MSSSKAWK